MFAGRYYKHQKDGQTICFIVGRADSGDFVQVITNEKTWQYDSALPCRVGRSGLTISTPQIRGCVRYGAFAPLHADIMGPFRHLPMQCRHEIVSMYHTLSGGFVVDGTYIDLSGGVGYIEGDRGRSFPRQYLWLHCNDFEKPCSVSAAVADIPFCGGRFTGCICAVCVDGREYRLATYHGVNIVLADKRRLILQQGRLRLEVEIDASGMQPLKAPKDGRMIGTIHESNCTRAHIRFWAQGRLLIDQESRNCSFECNLPGA